MILRLTLFLYTSVISIVSLAQMNSAHTRAWGRLEYKDKPWVQKTSRANKISKGLNNKHLAIWASHGRYFSQEKMTWQWQRPNLFCTTEDLFTQTIVVPYLIPMLENAGANVFTPRERDWQTNEIIVDNDDINKGITYLEVNVNGKWQATNIKGFAQKKSVYTDRENPFEHGTARMAPSTKRNNASLVSYQPNFPQTGRYAVYVSYQTIAQSVDDAEYIVYHKGQTTTFRVNQQMGGGTWVYLGTFDFDEGCNQFNRVVITNNSRKNKRWVTTDAVRFGGGMGNIKRGFSTSYLPRAIEGARYYAQWAGAPYDIYSKNNGENDYADDINVRPAMTNWLAGGSIFMPTLTGLNVPIELSLAVHSDAGFANDGKSLIGSLAIATTKFNGGRLNSGISRMTSLDFANDLLNNLVKDLSQNNVYWPKRYLWNRNYGETRVSEVPSAIIETLSHQNFPDMALGHDPNFKFLMARSIYKTILRYVNHQHGNKYVVQPLAPRCFSIEMVGNKKIKLSWNAQTDPQEPTATPTSYNIYTSAATGGFDDGKNVNSTSYTIELQPDVQYNFKITACNKGGESFPTETLSAYIAPNAHKTVLVVNGFHRLSAPQIIDNDQQQGFDLNADIGVSYGLTAGWVGQQIGFDKNKMGNTSESGLGYSTNELAGKFIMGNTFDYVVDHTRAIAATKKYNVVSASSEAVSMERVKLTEYNCIDWILGLEKYDFNAFKFYKTFTLQLQKLLSNYAQHGGALMVSGAYIGSDLQQDTDNSFLNNVLKGKYIATDTLTKSNIVNGLGLHFDFYQTPNNLHYAAMSPNSIAPINGSMCVMAYGNNASAATAYKDNHYRCFTMGFPFECIIDPTIKKQVMHGILNFLLE